MVLREIIVTESEPTKRSIRWLQVVIILPVGGSTNYRLSVVILINKYLFRRAS
jgi:hypothetical protein